MYIIIIMFTNLMQKNEGHSHIFLGEIFLAFKMHKTYERMQSIIYLPHIFLSRAHDIYYLLIKLWFSNFTQFEINNNVKESIF